MEMKRRSQTCVEGDLEIEKHPGFLAKEGFVILIEEYDKNLMKLCNSMMMTMMKDRLGKTNRRRDGGCRKERLKKEKEEEELDWVQ